MIKSLFVHIFILFSLSVSAQDTVQRVVANRLNAIEQQKKPYVILISADGFRWDLADKYGAKNLINLRQQGVQAEYLQSSFPSLTFPNHYTIVTGLYPAHHGFVDNYFYDKKKGSVYKRSDKVAVLDSSWYDGKPLWTLAEQQQMLSAIFYWPGSEVAIEGVKPTYSFAYNESVSMDRRVNIVKEWLQLPAEKRPHFIAFYLPQVDAAEHKYTADSENTKLAVELVDQTIGKLVDIAKASGLDVNFIFLSDHGMTAVGSDYITLPQDVDLSQFKITGGGAIVHLYANEQADVLKTYHQLKQKANHYDVYLSKDIPPRWHYNTENDIHHRVGDMIIVPQLPYYFAKPNVEADKGQHGFDPAIKDMHATFYAWGSAFKANTKVPAFENVNVYPIVANILGLKFSHKIDGNDTVLKQVLKVNK